MKTASHWIHMYNKEKQWIISFTYMWKHEHLWLNGGPGGGGGFNIFRLGLSWFTYTLHLLIIYMSNIEAIWFFFGVMLGPYIKSRGTRGTKMSANADLITVETYVQQGETIWKPFFHLWAKMLKKCIFWGYFGGPEGVFNDQTKPILLSSYPLTHIYVHVK